MKLKKAIAIEWLTSYLRKVKPSLTGQSTGEVSYILLTNQVNERQ